MDKSKIAADLFDKFAKRYEEKFMDFDLYNASFDLFCSLFKTKEPTVLELGCGPGNCSRYLLDKKTTFKIHGVDLAPTMIELAKKNVPEGRFEVMDCRQIAALKGSYDAAFCGFVLPYLSKSEVENLIKDIVAKLNTGGLLFLSTMEDEYEKSDWKSSSSGSDKAYIHYYSLDFLSTILQKAGFKIIHTNRIQFPEANESASANDLIVIAQLLEDN